MTNKKQTAVQWLKMQLALGLESKKWIWAKALEMEREQIETAYNQGIEATFQFHYGDGKQHYNDNYQTEP